MTSFTSLVCPVIVGRTHDLDALERQLDGGGPPVVVIRIAQGTSNRAIAAEMVVAERTVEGYVGNTLAKLAFTSRAQVAARAVAQGLTRGAE